MTSKLVVNTIESDTGISSVSFASSISMSSTSKFHFSAVGIDIGADTNINRPEAGVLGFNINGSEKVRINSNGFIGINTSSPLAPLHTYNDTNNTIARLESGDATCRLQLKDSAGEGYVIASGDNLILANTSSITERLRINSNGLVGIGTNNPTRELTIYSPDSGSTYINLTNATTGTNTSDGFGIGLGGDEDAKLWNYENTHMIFATNSTERLRITSTGQFIVGTNPSVSSGNIVHIEAPTSFNSGETIVNIEGNNAAAAARIVLHNNNTGGSAYNEILGADAGGQSTSSIRFYNTDQANNYGEIAFGTRNASGVPPADRMRISKDGYVTKPAHPAFHARLQSNTNATTNPLVYGDVRVNNGSHYKSSGTDAGKFVVPVAGMYFFYLVAVKSNNGSVCRLYPYVNGSKIYNNMHLRLQETGTYSNGSLQFIYTCGAGDKVHVSLEAGSVLGAEYTHFGGHLIG